MFRLIFTGVLSAAFFSSTFVLNRAMSLEGGHWLWSAILRYGFMLCFLISGMVLSGHGKRLKEIFAAYRENWTFWTVSGSTGFGVFYSMLCFSASYAPGWVVATTWQTTILASPLVLLLFGKKVPTKALLFIMLIFTGIVLVNLEHATTASLKELALGALPILVAAFAYPLGNQMVWEAQRGGCKRIPDIQNPLLHNAFSRITLLTLGSIPFWIILAITIAPPPPSSGQWFNTALVALFSGIIATSLFLHARHLATNAYEISAIDSTQSSEVLFSLLGEIIFLGGVLPGTFGMLGIALTMTGLIFYVKTQYSHPNPADS